MLVRVVVAMLLLFVIQPIGDSTKPGVIYKTEIPVPPSLMLHSNSIEFLPEFLDLIEKEGYTTTTYREFGQMVASSQYPVKKLIIISIDDYGPYRIKDSLKTMADELKRRGMVAVLGLVVTERIDSDTWDYLHSLKETGFEIASHSVSHGYLPGLPDNKLRAEIEDSYELISSHLAAPVSLVLPYGGFEGDQRIIQIAGEKGYKFVVGIAGGKVISDSPINYVGRASPYLKQPEKTLSELERQFPGWLNFALDKKSHQKGESLHERS